jgi:formylglycine-generating enzyme required for sulfatase activity
LAALPAKDEMVLIPSGPFLMGSNRQVDRNSYPPEFPQRTVHMDAYEIDKYEVTMVQFLRYVLAKNLEPLVDWKWGGVFQEPMASHPVMHVSWYDADRGRVGESRAGRGWPDLPMGEPDGGPFAGELRKDRAVWTGTGPP